MTSLSGLDLDDVTSGGVTGTPVLPTNWILAGGYLVGPHANLAAASLGTANLSAADLSAVSSGGVTGTPVLPANWTLVQGYLIGPGASLEGANLAGANLTGVDLDNAVDLTLSDLNNADLHGANLTNANLMSAVMNGADFSDANLDGASLSGGSLLGASSGGIAGTPASLPPNWQLWHGYLIGSEANLTGADLTGLDLSNSTTDDGLNLTGANLTNANFSGAFLASTVFTNATVTNTNLADAVLEFSRSGGISGIPAALPASWSLVQGYLVGPFDFLQNASLAGANLTGLDLFSTNLTGADLTSANLTSANLTRAVLQHANLASATLTETNLTNANLTGLTDVNAIWSNSICPNSVNSDAYVDGCLSALDTTPPVVTVTGVSNDAVYVRGAAPAAGCKTTDNSKVAVPAKLIMTAKGVNGVGRFTATCAGAEDRAGNEQAAPVSATYVVAYGFGGFTSPVPGSTVAKSARTIAARFRLTGSNGAAITSSTAAALATARKVKSTLTGPGIKPVAAVCTWSTTARVFNCTIKIPAGVQTGKSHRYSITTTENLGTGFIRVPVVAKKANPEVIHFK